MSRRIDAKRIAIVTFAAVFVLAGASAFIGYSGNLVEDILTGAAVGAVAGLLTCMAICVLGDKLMPEPDIRQSPEGRLTNAIIGGYVGLIATGVLVTIAVTMADLATMPGFLPSSPPLPDKRVTRRPAQSTAGH